MEGQAVEAKKTAEQEAKDKYYDSLSDEEKKRRAKILEEGTGSP